MASLRRSLLLLASGGFVSGVSLRMAEPLLPTVADDLGVGVADAAILITAFTLAYGLFQLVHGPLGDRFGKIRTVAVAMLLAAAGSGACATAATLGEFAVYRFLTGMTAGAVIPLSFAFVGDNIPFETRQTVLGRFIAGTLLGATCGPLVGGICSDLVGWRASFLVPAVAFAVIGLALALQAGSETVTGGRGPGSGPVARYLALMRSAAARSICLAVTIEGGLFYGAFAYLGAFLRFRVRARLHPHRHHPRRLRHRRRVLQPGRGLAGDALGRRAHGHHRCLADAGGVPGSRRDAVLGRRRSGGAGTGVLVLSPAQHPADPRHRDGTGGAGIGHLRVRLLPVLRPGAGCVHPRCRGGVRGLPRDARRLPALAW